MSHITVIKVRIKNASMDLLKQAVEALAKEHNGQVTTSIEDYYGHAQKVDIGLKCPEMRRGFGFSIVNGEVEVKGDDYGCNFTIGHVQKELTQQYTAIANITSLRQMGFQTSQSKVGSKIVIKAFAW